MGICYSKNNKKKNNNYIYNNNYIQNNRKYSLSSSERPNLCYNNNCIKNKIDNYHNGGCIINNNLDNSK